MTHKICYWDESLLEQRERDSTPEEDAQRELDIQSLSAKQAKSLPTKDEINAVIYDQLLKIDLKSIRPLREGDQVRIDDLKAQAATLRAQLVP